MSEPLTLDLVDRDGAIREAHEEGMNRSALFRRAVVGGGTFLAGGLLVGGLPRIALGKPSAAQDGKILNFALLLEYLESAFYVDAVDKGALRTSPRLLGFATTVRDHELAHVDFLRRALGGAAIAEPSFDFKGTTEDADTFAATALVLEDTGVAAYNGQGPRLRARTSTDTLIQAGSVSLAGVAFAAAALRTVPLLSPIMMFGGLAWISVLSSLNVAAQQVSPPWVKGRALAVYLIVFQAAVAIGSALWGLVASQEGLSMAYCGIAIGLATGPAATASR